MSGSNGSCGICWACGKSLLIDPIEPKRAIQCSCAAWNLAGYAIKRRAMGTQMPDKTEQSFVKRLAEVKTTGEVCPPVFRTTARFYLGESIRRTGDQVREAVRSKGIPVTALASRFGLSVNAIYMAFKSGVTSRARAPMRNLMLFLEGPTGSAEAGTITEELTSAAPPQSEPPTQTTIPPREESFVMPTTETSSAQAGIDGAVPFQYVVLDFRTNRIVARW